MSDPDFIIHHDLRGVGRPPSREQPINPLTTIGGAPQPPREAGAARVVTLGSPTAYVGPRRGRLVRTR
jgi:hypothetical protein